jgi:RimJ/RimL family protein N-acetyltransferase
MADFPFDPKPTLKDNILFLRPLTEQDREALYEVASDPLIWEQHPSSNRHERKIFDTFFDEAMRSGAAFAVVDRKSKDIIGSTRFHPVNESNDAIEIGWSFLARKYWGGEYNGRMKTLMIDYAFKYVHHVLFYIGAQNFRSQKAVEKIGGVRITELKGVLLEKPDRVPVIYEIEKRKWNEASVN